MSKFDILHEYSLVQHDNSIIKQEMLDIENKIESLKDDYFYLQFELFVNAVKQDVLVEDYINTSIVEHCLTGK